jgi:hypothetical protein
MKSKSHEAASYLSSLKMKKVSPERRREIAKFAASMRWAGHEAKRPADSRKKR